MFHYRLATSNNRSRMLIAAILAVAAHMAFMNFVLVPKPLFVPSVSLPRSVSILLRQSSNVQIQEQQDNNTQNVSPIKDKQQTVEEKPDLPASPKAPALKEKPNNLFQQPVLLEKTAKKSSANKEEKSKPDIEDSGASYQKAEQLKPEAGEAVNAHKFDTQVDPQAVQEEAGAILPGSIQLAYPRYQLNTPPAYPGLSRKRGQEGTVTLQVLVNSEGNVERLEIDISSNFSLLDRAALAAVRKWSFEPGRRGEQKVPMWVRVPVTFKLKK